MALQLNKGNLHMINNPVFAAYAESYQNIYDDFQANVKAFGLPFAVNREQEIAALREEIDALGVLSRNNGASLVHGQLCGACEACRTGVDSYTGLISLMCHRSCFFCFNPNQYEYDQLASAKKDWAGELERVYRQNKNLKYIALTGGEPLLHKKEAVEYFCMARKLWPSVSMRLYTSGDLLDEKTLEQFAQAGLEEIRFSLKIEDDPSAMEKVYAAMEMAKRHVPRVMVEMPVMPDAQARMEEILDRLEAIGIYGINLLELCFPFHNAQAFAARGYELRNPPYKTLYNFWYAGGLPVDGSEILALKLLRYAIQKQYRLTVHYCSLENKHFGQIYMQNTGAARGDKTLLMSQKDFYLKTVKAFGDDARRVKAVLDANKLTQYKMDAEHGYIQFAPACAGKLADLDMELAISYNVREMRGGEEFIRELRLDYVKAKDFTEQDL